MLEKIFKWYEENHIWIEKILSVVAIVELFIIVLLFTALGSTVEIIHGMEVQLAAHGVEWALYTPIP